MRNIPTVAIQVFQTVFQLSRVGIVLIIDFDIVTVHPIFSAPESVDFSIMSQKAKWLGPVPTRKGIGRKTRVGQGDARLHGRID